MTSTRIDLSARWRTDQGIAALEEVRNRITDGKSNWPQVLHGFPGADEVKGGRDLRGVTLTGLIVQGNNLKNTDFSQAIMRGCQIRGADLSGSTFVGTNIVDSLIEKSTFKDAKFLYTYFKKVSFSEADFTNSYFERAHFKKCLLDKTKYNNASLLNVAFLGSLLGGTDFTNVRLFQPKFIETNIEHIHFGTEHNPLTDGSETIVRLRRDRYLNWSILRLVGKFPLFGVSWVSFVCSIGLINAIGALNHTQLITTVSYPIPIPMKMILILIDSILLVVGSTIYRLGCPQRIQEFTESRWVEEHKQPRLLYYGSSWSRKGLQVLTLIFIALGAGLGAYLIGERLYLAFRHLIEALLLSGNVG